MGCPAPRYTHSLAGGLKLGEVPLPLHSSDALSWPDGVATGELLKRSQLEELMRRWLGDVTMSEVEGFRKIRRGADRSNGESYSGGTGGIGRPWCVVEK